MSKKLIACSACGYRGEYPAWNKLEFRGYQPVPFRGYRIEILVCPRCSTLRSSQESSAKEMDHD